MTSCEENMYADYIKNPDPRQTGSCRGNRHAKLKLTRAASVSLVEVATVVGLPD
jgi:hypothetical protein